MKGTWSCLTLCNPIDCSPPGFSGHGILQARMLEWVAIPFPRGSSRPRERTSFSCSTGKLVWRDSKLQLLSGSLNCFQAIVVPILTEPLLSARHCANVRDQGVNKANMTPAFKELTVQWGHKQSQGLTSTGLQNIASTGWSGKASWKKKYLV